MFSSLARTRALLPKSGVRWGHAEFDAATTAKFYRMTAEGTALGLFFAVMWRVWHNSKKAEVNKYYESLRAE